MGQKMDTDKTSGDLIFKAFSRLECRIFACRDVDLFTCSRINTRADIQLTDLESAEARELYLVSRFKMMRNALN